MNKLRDLSQYNTMVGMKYWCWELLTCACQSPNTCLQPAPGKGSRTCLPPWAVLHKALHLCQVHRSSLSHRFLLRETQQRFKVEIKNTQRESSMALQPLRKFLGSQSFLLYVSSPNPRKNHLKYFLFVGPNPLSRIKTVWLTLLDV